MYIHYDILYYGTEYKLQVCVLGTVLEYYSAVAHARRKKPNLTARSSGIVRVEGCERGGDRVPWGFNKALSSTRRRLDFYPLLLRTESQKRRGENLANWGSDDPVTNQSLGNSDEQGGSTEGHPRPPQDRMTDPWRDTRQARKGQKKGGVSITECYHTAAILFTLFRRRAQVTIGHCSQKATMSGLPAGHPGGHFVHSFVSDTILHSQQPPFCRHFSRVALHPPSRWRRLCRLCSLGYVCSEVLCSP